jgi:hypothetical protein
MGTCLAAASLIVAWLTGVPGWLLAHDPLSSASDSSAAALLKSMEARIGLIFISSINEDTCRERLFDNLNGNQRNNGIVDCKVAIALSKRSQTAERMNAITDAFRPK